MTITKNNYESYFLDYHEGNLNDQLKRELFDFLESHPDLKEEFDSFEMISVSAPDKKFFDKDRLKKNTITLFNYKTWFISYLENDLHAEERKDVELFVEKNPFLRRELEIFRQTKLIPDHRIVFEDKKQLKRGGKVILFTPRVYRVAVAATIAFLLITYFFLRNHKEQVLVHREPVNRGTLQPSSAPSKENKAVYTGNNEEIKQESGRKNKSIEKKYSKVKTNPSIKEDRPVNENKTDPPVFAQHEAPVNQNQVPQHVTENKDSSGNLFADNKAVHQPYKPTVAQLSEVFSKDDLEELGMTNKVHKDQKTTLWDVASKGAKELGKVTGTDIALNKHGDESENTSSYALAIGNFSISRTTTK
jgi:hypothetical protein